MLRNKLNNKKKKKGFTLIELIVVLAVLAIIALIAIPNFNQIRENSKIKSDERSIEHIEKAVDMLIVDGTITTAMKAYDYVVANQNTAPEAPTTEPQLSIYKSIKGTDAPQASTSAGVKKTTWTIEVITDPNFTGGLKAQVTTTK